MRLTRGLVADVCAGSGFGLLLGVIVGLSQTPVVTEVITALTGLLAVFLGLQAGAETKIPLIGRLQLNNARIASFGIATVLGLVLGLFLRIANPFAEPPDVDYARWTKVFPDNPVLARQAMLYERMGVKAANWNFDPNKADEASVDADQAKSRRAALFGVLQRPNLCTELDPENFGGDPESVLTAYDIPGEPVLNAVAEEVRSLPEAEQRAALATVHLVFCELKKEQQREAGG